MQTSGETRREIARSYLRRMDRSKRNPSPTTLALMGFASLYPSYEIRSRATRNKDAEPHKNNRRQYGGN